MVLTRALNQPGPDGIVGDDLSTPAVDESTDDDQDANNTDSPWVDQSQTYTSHSSHQVFLREYEMVGGKPVSTGKLLGGAGAQATGMVDVGHDQGSRRPPSWGLRLEDKDVLNVPMLAADPYGNFLPGPERPAAVRDASGLVEGDLTTPVPVPSNVDTSTRRSSRTSRTTRTRARRTPTTTRATTRWPPRLTATTPRRRTSPTSPQGRTTTRCSTRTSPPVTDA